MKETPMPYDRLYVEFVYHFNVTEDYFECHEVMEQLWLENGRSPLYQGLLQVAVGLYHHRNGNVSGAIKLFTAGIAKLELQAAAGIGIDLTDLLNRSRAYRDGLVEHGADWPFAPFRIAITDPELARRVDRLIEHPPEPEQH
jgi:hypothetical protein